MYPKSLAIFALLASFLLAGLVLVACGETQPTTSPPLPSQATTAAQKEPETASEGQVQQEEENDEDLVKAVALLYQMKGHLYASRELWEQGHQLAPAHAAHPQSELLALVADDLAAKQPGSEVQLRQALERLPKLVAENTAPAGEIQEAYEAALAAIDGAITTLAGEQRNDPAFVAQVIVRVLDGVSREYAEAVQEEQGYNLEEYQDAYGFLQVTRQAFDRIAETVKAKEAKEYAEIQEAFEELAKTFSAATAPPSPPTDPSLVSAATKTIQAELGEVFGFTVSEAPGGNEGVLTAIREQVERAIREYEEGEVEEAYELAASAYLDGFERLEGELLGKDPELVETLEIQFKELRDKIKAGAPVEELRAIQKQIEENLEKVDEILEGGKQ